MAENSLKERVFTYLQYLLKQGNINQPKKKEVSAMPDYAAMYKKLFNSQTDAIALLQKAQQETEEMYMSSPEPDIRVLHPKNPEGDTPSDE